MTEEQIKQKALEAEIKAGGWLGKGNEFLDCGNKKKADECYQRAQFWHDRYNKLVGNA